MGERILYADGCRCDCASRTFRLAIVLIIIGIKRLTFLYYFCNSFWLAWWNTRSNAFASEDGKCDSSESGWPSVVERRTERGIVLDNWRFAFSFSSCFNQKRKFRIGLLGFPQPLKKNCVIARQLRSWANWPGYQRISHLIGLPLLFFLFQPPFYAKRAQEILIFCHPFSSLWICISSARVTSTQTNTQPTFSFFPISVHNYA